MVAALDASAVHGWPVVSFGKVAIAQSDRGQRLKQRDYLAEGAIPVIDQGQALIGGYTNDEDAAFAGELPVVLFGDHTRAVKLIQHRFAVGADGIKIFKPADGVRAKYLYYWMKSAPIPNRGYGRHYQYLRGLSVPLPPPEQQDEIVAELEKQFSRLDEAVANLQRVKANLKRYKASVLKDAVEGRLVPTEAELAHRENRSFETGVQLLQRILETRRRHWNGKRNYREPVVPEIADLLEVPLGWVWASPSQLSAGESYSLAIGPFGSSLKVTDYKTDGVPLVFVRNIRAVSFGGPDTVFITPEKAEELAPHSIEAGDILVTKMGAPPGDVCMYPATSPPAVITADCIKLRLMREQLCASFFGYAIESKLVQSQILGITKGVAQLKVSLGNFCSIAFPLPPVAEQFRIVAEVDRRLSLVRGVDAEVDANLKRAQALRQATLQTAFGGADRMRENEAPYETEFIKDQACEF